MDTLLKKVLMKLTIKIHIEVKFINSIKYYAIIYF